MFCFILKILMSFMRVLNSILLINVNFMKAPKWFFVVVFCFLFYFFFEEGVFQTGILHNI